MNRQLYLPLGTFICLGLSTPSFGMSPASPAPPAPLSAENTKTASESAGIKTQSTLIRGPYLQTASPTSITIRWRTDVLTDSSIWLGSTPDNLDQLVHDNQTTTEHIVTLGGLNPGTRYYYAIGDSNGVLAGGDESYHFVASPEVGTRQPIRIWAIGDSGTADDRAARVRDAYLERTGDADTSFWLMLGDNAYDSGTDEQYQAAVFDMYPQLLKNSPLWTTLGNHDSRSANGDTQQGVYFNIFSLPTKGEAGGLASGSEAYYSFDYANVHVVCLNSMSTDRSPDGAMLTWLEEDLANTNQEWLIAFWHHPPYSKGSHDSDIEVELVEMRRYALPILEEAGVDLVLSGHSHSYERSYLLDAHYGSSDTLTSDMLKDDGDGREDGDGIYDKASASLAPHEGAVYVVAGSSGKTSDADLDHPAMTVSLEVLGSVILEIDGLRLDATFLDDQGNEQDHFTIVKGSDLLPDAPANAQAVDGGNNDVQLTWTDESDDEDGFRIFRHRVDDDVVVWETIARVDANEQIYLDPDVREGGEFEYRVAAFNEEGDSAYSNLTSVYVAPSNGCRGTAMWPFGKDSERGAGFPGLLLSVGTLHYLVQRRRKVRH